MDFEGIEHV